MGALLEDLFSLDGPYARVMNWLWNMIVISVLWVLCCIPVVTIGAASTAAYYATAKVVRHHTGRVVSEFFSSFRVNFKQATILTVIYGLVFGLLIVESIYLYSDASVPLVLLYVFYFMIMVVLSAMLYLWPCLSRFVKSNFELFRMSAILVFRHLITTVLLLLIFAAMLVSIYLMPWGVLIIPGVMYWLQTFLLEKVLLRYSPKPSEDDPESQKWYYQ